MMRKAYFFCTLLALIHVGCELQIDIEDDLNYEAQLVVSSVIQPNDNIVVYVGKSQFILDESTFEEVSQLQVQDVTLRMYEDGALLNATFDPGILFPTTGGFIEYRFPFQAKAGSTYRLEVEETGFPMAFAEETVLEEPATATTQNVDYAINQDQFLPRLDARFDLIIADGPGDDYYEVIADLSYDVPYRIVTDTGQFVTTDSLEEKRFRSRMETNSLVIEDYFENRIIFNDQLFEGSNFTINLTTTEFIQEIELIDDGVELDVNYDPNFRLFITVNRLSASYYSYITTAGLQESLSGDPFAEPVQVYSNIENGLGYFGSYHPLEIEVPLE